MPVFKDVRTVKSVATQAFDPFDGIEVRQPKEQPRKEDTVEEAKKVQALTRKFVQAANGENSGICLAALDELRSAVRPTPQEEMVLGQTNLDTQRRLGKLLDAVGGPSKFEPPPVQNGANTKLVQSAPEMSPMDDPEPEPKQKIEEVSDKGKRKDRFTVRVNKEPGTKLGITTCWADGEYLIVCAMISGLVQDYNAKQPPTSQVEVGDRIISIDGQAAPLDSLKETMLKASGEFSFEVQTASKYTVNVRRGEDDKLGLDVTNKPYDQTLLVRNVLPGVVSNWNVSGKGQKVSKGDRIVAINGSVGPGQLLRKMVNEARGDMNLSMIRNRR